MTTTTTTAMTTTAATTTTTAATATTTTATTATDYKNTEEWKKLETYMRRCARSNTEINGLHPDHCGWDPDYEYTPWTDSSDDTMTDKERKEIMMPEDYRKYKKLKTKAKRKKERERRKRKRQE